ISQKNCKMLGMPLHSSTIEDPYMGFASNQFCGEDPIKLEGIPDFTLQHNYLLAIRALRFAANFDAKIEPNTWLAIVRSSGRVLDYVPARDIMDEWRKVAAESMHRFVRLMYDAHILQGIIPEVTALASIPQTSLGDNSHVENVFDHTLECMKLYTEHDFHYDWLGTMAMFFHDVGKLFTCEYLDGEYTFFQHHRIGAKVTRKILQRLHFDYEDIDLICHLVANHMRFHFMMTDRGIRRFKALDEYPRLIAMARADIEAREDKYTSFNHNMKYLARADSPEQMLEPLLNGNEIMRETNLAPGPLVGSIRESLLKAQISGEVGNRAQAIEFVKNYVQNLDK
ncbi:MAG: HD domain-containing protein, partial [Desulfovibrio sp.]|nr:HD domain-containing protein [Desulfovibrio sp.]